MRTGIAVAAGLGLAICLMLGMNVRAQQGPRGGQWPNHSGDKGSTKYSSLDQITRNNVRNLKVVWRRPAAADEFRKRRRIWSFPACSDPRR